jgi:carboxymethylenebutenolidase
MRQVIQSVIISLGVFLLIGVIHFLPPVSAHTKVTTANPSSQMMESHRGDRPIASAAVAQDPAQPVQGERVQYGTVDGTAIEGYLARPREANAALPGLIIIHEWWGLNDNIEAMTRRLAGEGYTALAVDLFGQVATTPERAKIQVQAATANPQKLQDNLRQAYRYLETDQSAPKIGSLGWCFGGSWSLNTALLFPNQLDAAVIYYGGQLVTEPEQLRPLQLPILGIFGALDDNPSVETVKAFESALKSLGKPVEIHIYEGADHAFANPSGNRYNAQAAEDAWSKTTAFLERTIK